jgi:RNA polymerase sigma factor (sigma-70 family)
MSYAAGLLISLKERLSYGEREVSTAEGLMDSFIKTGDDTALSMLFDMYSNKLYYFLVVLSDTDLAADVSQKTWVKVIEKKHLYKAGTRVDAWLFTIGRHALIDELRRTKRVVYDSDMVEQSASENAASGNVDKTDFNSMLVRLPFLQREALSLQLEGFSIQQISDICHAPSETIKTRIRYAKDNLKSTLRNK